MQNFTSWAGHQVNRAANWVGQQWNNFQQSPSYQSAYHYVTHQEAQAQAQAEQRRQQHIQEDYAQATGMKTTPKTREGASLFCNWGKALKDMYKHVCTTAKRIKKDTVSFIKQNGLKILKVVANTASTVSTALGNFGETASLLKNVGGYLRNASAIARMGGSNGFVIQNPSSTVYKAGNLFGKAGALAKVFTSKTFAAIGFAAGVTDDMANNGKTFGQAVAHNGAGALLSFGAGLVTTALIGATPIGWGALAVAGIGILVNTGYDLAYSNNFLGIQDKIDTIGSKIDNGINMIFNPKKKEIGAV